MKAFRLVQFGAVFGIVGLATSSLSGQGAWAQVTADDVVCTRCVDTSDIESRAVTSGKLENGAVTKNKIQNGAVKSRHIGPGQVTGGKLAPNAVTSDKIADRSIRLQDLDLQVLEQLDNTAVSTSVDCGAGGSVQDAVDAAAPGQPTTIFLSGTCTEDVIVRKDDIVLSGNESSAACNKANPTASAGATLDGTITFYSVRGAVEHLRITGGAEGVNVLNRAAAKLTCNDIVDNDGTGVIVQRSSNAVLQDNKLRGNGRQIGDFANGNPFIYFDCGLFAGDGASVYSVGNTYENNQYCAVEVDRQSAFRNGAFLPRDPANPHPADPNERDVFIERGCSPTSGAGCLELDGGPVAIEVFNGGLVDLRNAEVYGQIEPGVMSSFRMDGDGLILGNVSAFTGSMVSIRDRFNQLGDREVDFTGQLRCFGLSQPFGTVQCSQICAAPGDIPSSCRFPQCNDGLDNDGDGFFDLDDGQCRDENDDNESVF